MRRPPRAAWALALASRSGLRVLDVGAGTAPGAAFDLAWADGVSVPGALEPGALEAAFAALAPGGVLVVTGAGRSTTGAVRRAGFTGLRAFAAIPDASAPKYLVPIDHRGASAYFFRSVVPPTLGRTERGLLRLAGLLARAGLLDLVAPGRHVLGTKAPRAGEAPPATAVTVDAWLRDEAAAIMDPARAREVSFILISGWRDDGTTLTALGFAPDARSPSWVAKAAFGARVPELDVLRRNLEILGAKLAGDEGGRVPRLLHAAVRPGASVLFESVVAGVPLRVPRGEAALRAFAARASNWLIEFHRRTGPGKIQLDDATTERLLVRPFEKYRAQFRPGPEEAAMLEQTARDARALAAHPFPVVLMHGDFCPENLVEHRGSIGVVDWEAPLEPALPAQDLIHFLACLAVRGRRDSGYHAFEEAFFSSSELARIARETLLDYASRLELPRSSLEALFTIFWIDYALEKAAAEGGISGEAGGPLWGLARFERGTCSNLERLARSGDEFSLRRP